MSNQSANTSPYCLLACVCVPDPTQPGVCRNPAPAVMTKSPPPQEPKTPFSNQPIPATEDKELASERDRRQGFRKRRLNRLVQGKEAKPTPQKDYTPQFILDLMEEEMEAEKRERKKNKKKAQTEKRRKEKKEERKRSNDGQQEPTAQ